MDNQYKSVLPKIESAYEKLTQLEKSVADFFLSNRQIVDFSAKSMSVRLAISEATLSRFAKKCGFRGYREFIYLYESSLNQSELYETVAQSSKSVLRAYEILLNKSYSLIDEDQMSRVTEMLSLARRTYVAGKGSSGYAAMEMAHRFIRVGVDINALTDSEMMMIQAVMRQEDDLAIGFSLSGASREVVGFLQESKRKGATTVLVTASADEHHKAYCDEIIFVPSLKHMDRGNLISPQFPLLVLIDMLYTSFMELDRARKLKLHEQTRKAIDK